VRSQRVRIGDARRRNVGLIRMHTRKVSIGARKTIATADVVSERASVVQRATTERLREVVLHAPRLCYVVGETAGPKGRPAEVTIA
ncbi:hypothetical protein ACSTH1_23570, partial [Vibrio parahaemolyticus]